MTAFDDSARRWIGSFAIMLGAHLAASIGVLLGNLERHHRYPRQAGCMRDERVSHVHFVVDRHGNHGARIARGSGHASLDKEALATLRRASPAPPPADVLGGESMEEVVPVEFFIRRR